jgi:heme-degrading monooxygenase HmoA
MTDYAFKPLFNINVFTPKPGRIDDFIRRQIDFVDRLGDVRGLTESRLFRAEDESSLVVISGWESAEAFRDFQNSIAFQEERAKLARMIESTRPGFYRLVRERERAPSMV